MKKKWGIFFSYTSFQVGKFLNYFSQLKSIKKLKNEPIKRKEKKTTTLKNIQIKKERKGGKKRPKKEEKKKEKKKEQTKRKTKRKKEEERIERAKKEGEDTIRHHTSHTHIPTYRYIYTSDFFLKRNSLRRWCLNQW